VKTTTRELCAYAGLIGAAGIAGLLLSWTVPAQGIDNSVYDFFFRMHMPPAWPLETEILGIDEQTLNEFGGVGGIRKALARGIEIIAPAHPKAIAVDVILAEPNPADAELEKAFRTVPKIVLSSDLLTENRWDDPIPRFQALAAGVGQVHADLDRYDAVSRSLPLEKVAGRTARWALALEAFRASRDGQIVQSPRSLEVAGVTIPVQRRKEDGEAPMMRIRYVPQARGGIPGYSVAQLMEDSKRADAFRGKVVFAGVTAQTAMRDRWMTPFSGGISMAGVEMNANAFETIAHQLFLTDASDSLVLLFCATLVTAAGLIYAFAGGWHATAFALLLLACAHLLPYFAFTRGTVFPYMPGVLCAWLAVVSAASWRHFVTGRSLVETRESRARYQRAMQFVTHEMRTPLTAIQGSSELITRYALPDEKRKQIAGLINTESKRLARMIETFLNVERLSAGQMELKREHFSAPELVEQCVTRVRPLAERKNIEIGSHAIPEVDFTGDRELMEYAVYNLLTNAVKYSPPETRVVVSGGVSGGQARGELRLWVEDQGIGMDKQEVKRVFDRFYRTRKAEATGEAGTGIGLSIVEQIVTQHGGSILVDSTPGKGSRFTLVLPLSN
jgi:signal transduction histidine kinase